jgi:type II secretory pathway pseudopilin PulG
LLVVIAILGLMAGLTVPVLKNFAKSDATLGASRQLLDGVARARQLAISQRTTVYMVFVPGSFWTSLTPAQQTAATNLCDKQFTGYTFVASGAMGDQPGQHAWHYLAPWQTLPDGTFIATNKFTVPNQPTPPPIIIPNNAYSPFTIYGFITNAIPFPLGNSPTVNLPCIVFDSFGRLLGQNGQVASQHEYIPIAKGSVLLARDPATKTFQFNPPDASETPPGNSTNTANIVDIDPLTGRAVLEYQKMTP